jgi:hypothetical protein
MSIDEAQHLMWIHGTSMADLEGAMKNIVKQSGGKYYMVKTRMITLEKGMLEFCGGTLCPTITIPDLKKVKSVICLEEVPFTGATVTGTVRVREQIWEHGPVILKCGELIMCSTHQEAMHISTVIHALHAKKKSIMATLDGVVMLLAETSNIPKKENKSGMKRTAPEPETTETQNSKRQCVATRSKKVVLKSLEWWVTPEEHHEEKTPELKETDFLERCRALTPTAEINHNRIQEIKHEIAKQLRDLKPNDCGTVFKTRSGDAIGTYQVLKRKVEKITRNAWHTCIKCRQDKVRSMFSKSQFGRSPSKAKCIMCVQAEQELIRLRKAEAKVASPDEEQAHKPQEIKRKNRKRRKRRRKKEVVVSSSSEVVAQVPDYLREFEKPEVEDQPLPISNAEVVRFFWDGRYTDDRSTHVCIERLYEQISKTADFLMPQDHYAANVPCNRNAFGKLKANMTSLYKSTQKYVHANVYKNSMAHQELAACYAIIFKARLLVTLVHLDSVRDLHKREKRHAYPAFCKHMKAVNDAFLSLLATAVMHQYKDSPSHSVSGDLTKLFGGWDARDFSDDLTSFIGVSERMVPDKFYRMFDGQSVTLSKKLFDLIDSWVPRVFYNYMIGSVHNSESPEKWKLRMCGRKWNKSGTSCCYAVRIQDADILKSDCSLRWCIACDKNCKKKRRKNR